MNPRYFRLSAIVLALIAALFAVDRVLADLERSELQREARAQYQRGMSLLRKGDPAGALPFLERAHTLARGGREFSLGLSEALLAGGNMPEAESRLRDLLAADSNDGRANLLMARLLAAQNRPGEAIEFYHRAIYGSWRPADPAQQAVRLELAEYLAKTGRPRELLSELLLLEDRAATDPALARELARLFLLAGSGPRAADMYRLILRTSPADAKAYRGLAEAELASGDFRAAESALLLAIRHEPNDPDLPRRLQFANTLAVLDPTPRRLSSEAKFERANALLARVQAELAACPAAAAEESIPPEPAGRVSNEMAEARLSLAERLWEARAKACPNAPVRDEAAALVMRKLAATQ